MSFYDINCNCTYTDDDIIIETDNINDDEKDFVRNCVYRQDFLNIFKLDDFDDFDDNKINELFSVVKDDIDFYKCIEHASRFTISHDIVSGLFILFSYDYLYLTHKCICDFLRNGVVSKDNIKLLQDRLHSL